MGGFYVTYFVLYVFCYPTLIFPSPMLRDDRRFVLVVLLFLGCKHALFIDVAVNVDV